MPSNLEKFFQTASKAAPQLRRSVAGSSVRATAFDPTAGRVGASVGKVAATKVFPITLVFPVCIIPQMHHTHISFMTNDAIQSR
jgi:hypothetical protein